MDNTKETQHTLRGKLHITGILHLLTGMHIGASSDFAPIGAVDSPFIRDMITKQPIIPGSSLKGKLRTLVVKSYVDDYVLPNIENDPKTIKRLFGSAGKNVAQPARLQFFDSFMTKDSVQQFEILDTDTYIGEIKFENTINRLTASANPRQIERVPAGAEFTFELMYNVEALDEVQEDMQIVANGLRLLQMDYIGGHGSRGYGRVRLSDFKVNLFSLHADTEQQLKIDQIQQLLEESGSL